MRIDYAVKVESAGGSGCPGLCTVAPLGNAKDVLGRELSLPDRGKRSGKNAERSDEGENKEEPQPES